MNTKAYLQRDARKLDLYLYEYLFEDKSSKPILEELANYQNADGGFGHALEPDMRLPASSALATTVAFQYLSQIDADINSPLVRNAIEYLLGSYDATENRWVNIPPSADEYARAPWWNYDNAKKSVEWGNPSAEVLGYLLKYDPEHNDELIKKLYGQAQNRLHEIEEAEPHEIKCYLRLYDNASQEMRGSLYEPLAKHIKQVTIVNPEGWKGYVATPLTFIASPNSPFADLFDRSLLLENAAYIRKQMIDTSHWEPTWEWGQFGSDWAKAKKDWSGKITVDNLQTLRAFGLAAE